MDGPRDDSPLPDGASAGRRLYSVVRLVVWIVIAVLSGTIRLPANHCGSCGAISDFARPRPGSDGRRTAPLTNVGHVIGQCAA